MKIKVRALANLRHYMVDKKEEQMISISVDDCPGDECTVQDLLKKIEIPDSDIWKIIAVSNNRIVKKDHILSDGDELDIFPVSSGG